MTKIDQWPMWLQVVVIVPHAILFFAAMWFWWPRSGKGRYWLLAVLAYFWLFYLIFIR